MRYYPSANTTEIFGKHAPETVPSNLCRAYGALTLPAHGTQRFRAGLNYGAPTAL